MITMAVDSGWTMGYIAHVLPCSWDTIKRSTKMLLVEVLLKEDIKK